MHCIHCENLLRKGNLICPVCGETQDTKPMKASPPSDTATTDSSPEVEFEIYEPEEESPSKRSRGGLLLALGLLCGVALGLGVPLLYLNQEKEVQVVRAPEEVKQPAVGVALNDFDFIRLEAIELYHRWTPLEEKVRARQLFEQAATAGDIKAQQWIALCHFKGHCTFPLDRAKAATQTEALSLIHI